MSPRSPKGLALVVVALLLLAAAGGWAQTEDEARLREAARLRSVALADMEAGNFGRAAEQLERLQELLPRNALPPINLAICYFRLDRREEALREFLRARALAPDNPQLLYALAVFLAEDSERRELWSGVLERFAAEHPGDPRPWYLRARVAEEQGRWEEAWSAWQEAYERAPENFVVLVEMLVAAAQVGDSLAVEDTLYAIEDRLNGFEGSAATLAAELQDRLLDGAAEGLAPRAMVLRNVLRPQELYQVDLVALAGRDGGLQLFPQLDFEPPLPPSIQGGQDIEITFVQGQPPSAWTGARRALPLRRPDAEPLLLFGDGTRQWLPGDEGTEDAGAPAPPAGASVFAHDVDQDERTDLVVLSDGSRLTIHRGRDDGTFSAGEAVSLPEGSWDHVAPVDLDHDGDLDLLLTSVDGPTLYLQNGGSRFEDRSAEMGLDADRGTSDSVIADFDEDGDLDLVTVGPERAPALWINPRRGALELRLGALDAAGAKPTGVARADFEGDGRFDLLLWSGGGGVVLRNRVTGFVAETLPPGPSSWRQAEIGDLDNDGDPDVLVAGEDELWMLRNRRDSWSQEPLIDAAGLGDAPPVIQDLDRDGDLDLVLQRSEGLGWLENRGGERNGWIKLGLRGLNDNNAKNHTHGLFARIETRVGDALRVQLGNGGVNHIGLGANRQADVIRVVWTNGLSQTWQQVTAETVLNEKQVLKGSCPLLYTWTGDRFEFHTDLMWRSTLGMHFPDGSPMPHESARDWVRIPGERLRPTAGELWLQVTAELWETIYVDRQKLLVVDYPERDSEGTPVELVVDERFTPPPYPTSPPLHWIGRRLAPRRAVDWRGESVVEALLARDGRYVAELPLTRYQGVTREHALELEFDVPAGNERLRLLLHGWIFPTDTTINTALSQDPRRDARPPRLEALDAGGEWRVLHESIGLPLGKNKTMVIELGPALSELERETPSPLRLRLVTSMQLYWDEAALALGEPSWGEAEPRMTALDPAVADLHYRGFSRLYRESDAGPHLFDYADVSVEKPFRDMVGRYTRYGDVRELVLGSDDRSVIMAQGDELTLRYAAPPEEDGRRRDYVLFTDGWVKDADLHTLHSGTVEPLPYHGMSSYPDRPHRFPSSGEHRDWLERYQTRRIDDSDFRNALKPASPQR